MALHKPLLLWNFLKRGHVETRLKLNDVEKRLIRQAIERYRRIRPCSDRKSFAECFTSSRDTTVFWFNTEDDSTHILTAQA